MSSKKVKVFIGSSSEGEKVAKALKRELKGIAECKLWSEGVFGIAKTVIESLFRTLRDYEFAILVLTPDDDAIVRGARVRLPRDNVLFELGLFMGRYGQGRVFVVQEETTKLLTNLAGVSTAWFSLKGKRPCNCTLDDLQKVVRKSAKQVDTAIRDVQGEHSGDRAVHYIPPTPSYNQYFAHLQVRLEAELARLPNTSWHCHPPRSDAPEDVYLALEKLLGELGTNARRTDFVALVPVGNWEQRKELKRLVAGAMRTKSKSMCHIVFLDQYPPPSLLKHERVSFVGVDNHQVGVMAAFALSRELRNESDERYIVFDGPGGRERRRGFEKGLGFFVRRVKPIVIRIPDADRFEILQRLEQELSAFPDDQSLGIFAGNDEVASAVIRVMKGRVRVVGCDATHEMRFHVDSRNCVIATVDTNLRGQAKKLLQLRNRQVIWLEEPKLYPPSLQRAFTGALNNTRGLRKLWNSYRGAIRL